MLKQVKSKSVIEYATRFNALDHFASHYVATNGMRTDWFRYDLKGNLKKVVADHS